MLRLLGFSGLDFWSLGCSSSGRLELLGFCGFGFAGVFVDLLILGWDVRMCLRLVGISCVL